MKPTIYAAAALAVLLPGAASAVTATPELDNIVDGGETLLESGELYSFRYTETAATGGPQSFTYEFSSIAGTGTTTGVSINAVPSNGITGLFVQWLNATTGNVDDAWDGTSATFASGFAAGETKYLTIGWQSSSVGGDVNVNIQPVPVPAGILLLGTAMIGAGLLRKKRA